MNQQQYYDSFHADGYVVLKNAFDSNELQSLQQTVEIIVNDRLKNALRKHGQLPEIKSGSEIDRNILALYALDPQYIVYIQRTLCRTSAFFRLSATPKVIEVLKYLLDLPSDCPPYVTNNGVLFTVPCSVKDEHSSNNTRDNDFFHTIPNSRFVQIWAPLLHDATKEIGTLMVYPGSHKKSVEQHFASDKELFFHRYTISKKEVAACFKQRSIEVALGDVLIFSGTIIHCSGDNLSDKVRITMVSAFHDPTTSDFMPLSVCYQYTGITPEGYYYELTKDPRAIPLINEQAY